MSSTECICFWSAYCIFSECECLAVTFNNLFYHTVCAEAFNPDEDEEDKEQRVRWPCISKSGTVQETITETTEELLKKLTLWR